MTGRSGHTEPRRFVQLYALANVGAFVCFIPLIGLLLPQRALAMISGSGVGTLSWILLAGAIAASVANLAAGLLSDRLLVSHGSRLLMIGIGLAATLASFVALGAAESVTALIGAFLLFQLCFNLLFAPFNALATDHVSDAMKGQLFGLLSLGLPLAQLVIAVIVWLDITAVSARLAVVAAIAAMTIAPLLAFGRAAAGPPISSPAPVPGSAGISLPTVLWRDFALAWLGRLLIQCAAVVASSYLLLHLAGTDRAADRAERWFAGLSLMALVIGLVVGVIIGRWSDRVERRRPFLWGTALLVASGCLLLGLGGTWATIALGYALFAIGLTGFLTIDGAVVAQIVGRADNRGTRLGVMNLTNTLPSLLIPILALAFDRMESEATALLFMAVAVGAVIAAALVSMIRTIR